MADFKKKIKKNRFDGIPSRDQTSNNLEAPEHAPAKPQKKARQKTGRIEPLNFKVSTEFKKEFKKMALSNDKKLVELLEICFYEYKKNL
jgi:hypothetical protein